MKISIHLMLMLISCVRIAANVNILISIHLMLMLIGTGYISIHLMLMLIAELPQEIDVSATFQYISC